jgi:EAL domain-containing protein (putative c-di-GMP-specific phosphodiesterase class I)
MSERMQTYSVIALKELGVHVSVDDFGTGHSSLSKLRQLPVTELKIDKSFVIDMLEDENDEAIVEASIHLAHSLKLEVVAEGIENDKTLQRLKELGCDYAQGMYICKPMLVPGLLEWLGKRDNADQVA